MRPHRRSATAERAAAAISAARPTRDRGWLLILARGPERAKSRLAKAVGRADRARLAAAMLEDVLREASAVGDGWSPLVVTESRELARLARAAGAGILRVPARGTRASARTALARAAAAGATAALVIAADLPFARAADIRRVIAASVDGGRAEDRRSGAARRSVAVVIAPDRHGTGTNALLLRPPLALPPLFGRSSLEWHLAAARVRGLRARVVRARGLMVDIDTLADLAILRRRRHLAGARTRAALERIDGAPAGVTRRSAGPAGAVRRRSRARAAARAGMIGTPC